jgi:hypothetical protein
MQSPPSIHRISLSRHTPLILISAAILLIFAGRTLLAITHNPPRLFDLFDTLTVLGSLLVLLRGFRHLRPADWIAAALLGLVAGASLPFTTLFSPYPFFGLFSDGAGQAVLRGSFTLLAALGGLVILRQGGPVPFHLAVGRWREAGQAILTGLAVGLPLAVINVFALQFTAGRSIAWQNPLAALLDALQPAIVEEVVYRFALWGLLWMAMRRFDPITATPLAGILATLVHAFAHFDALFVQAPLVALGMGLALTLIWGLPPLFLARRCGLESAIAFHWIQDVARFLAGF